MDESNVNEDSRPARRVLVIENEQYISDLYARALAKKGYQVDIEADGEQGLKTAQTDKYDIILLDLMMPNMTGVEILKNLRDKTKTPSLKAKVIITTNLEEREDVREELERNADGYIIKAELTPGELAEFLDGVK
ncbi:MAG: response regulator transcription factor [Candidatus Saccharimonadales bacterium]